MSRVEHQVKVLLDCEQMKEKEQKHTEKSNLNSKQKDS
jgi:hypothetical protein